MNLNNFLGWVFLVTAFVVVITTNNAVYAMMWVIVAKLCWIHADIKEVIKMGGK